MSDADVKISSYRDEVGRPYLQYTINYPNGAGEFIRVPQFEVMSGQEWYDRFQAELEKHNWLGTEKTRNLVEHNQSLVAAAAKRAAGLTDKEPTNG